MKIPSNKIIVLSVIGLIVIVSIGRWITSWVGSNNEAKSYSIVYLSSLEIYVGHLHTYPRLMMTDAYLLQNVQTTTGKTPQTDVQLAPLSSKVWAPTEIYINPKQVLWRGPLNQNSDAYKAITKSK